MTIAAATKANIATWWLACVAGATVWFGAAQPGSANEPQRYEFSQAHMGVPFRILLYSGSEKLANDAAEAAMRRVAMLDAILSDYNPESELRKLCRTAGSGKAVRVSDDLYIVLEKSLDLSRRSRGAFDVTVGPLVRLWRRARRKGTMPSPERLEHARRAVGYEKVRLDPATRSVELLAPGMLLDLGGIAKGYAVDAALDVLRKRGIARALVDAGGDLAVGEAPPGKRGWRIGVAPLDRPNGAPSRYLWLVRQAVATSGDAFQFVEIDGVRYSHIIDPRTGLGLTTRASATVVAPNCTDADALASALCVLGSPDGLRLVDETPGAAALLVERRDEVLREVVSSRWCRLPLERSADVGSGR